MHGFSSLLNTDVEQMILLAQEFSEEDHPLIWINFTAMDNFCPLVSLAHVGDLLSSKAGHNDTAAVTTDTEGEGTPAPLLRFGKGHECSLSLGRLGSPDQGGAPGAGQLHCPHSAPQGQRLSPLQNLLSALQMIGFESGSSSSAYLCLTLTRKIPEKA